MCPTLCHDHFWFFFLMQVPQYRRDDWCRVWITRPLTPYYRSSPNSSKACSIKNPQNLIHKRLEYPSVSKLQKMAPNLSSLSTLDCESCQLRQHTCATFQHSTKSCAESIFPYFILIFGVLVESVQPQAFVISLASLIIFKMCLGFLDEISVWVSILPYIFFWSWSS